MPALKWSDTASIARAALAIPALTLRSTRGTLDLRALCEDRAALYVYPATGVPGRDPAVDPAPGWDDIPGAAGCTPQSLGFKAAHATFAQAGVRVAGISAQPLIEQADFAARHALPFPLICDEHLTLQRNLALPTFEVGGRTFLKRLVMYVEKARIAWVLYPVASPRDSARRILDVLSKAGKLRG